MELIPHTLTFCPWPRGQSPSPGIDLWEQNLRWTREKRAALAVAKEFGEPVIRCWPIVPLFGAAAVHHPSPIQTKSYPLGLVRCFGALNSVCEEYFTRKVSEIKCSKWAHRVQCFCSQLNREILKLYHFFRYLPLKTILVKKKTTNF